MIGLFTYLPAAPDGMAMGVGKVTGRVGAFGRFITSDKALLVGAATILSAVAVQFLTPYLSRIPGIGRHPFIFYLVAGFVVFFLAGMTGGKLMYLLQGVALGVFIQGILTFPAVRNAQASLLARAGR